MDDYLNECSTTRSARQTHLTVETDTTILWFVIDPNTGKLRLRESLTVEGASAPFVVCLNGEVGYVGIPVEAGGSFTVTASSTLS